MTHGGDIRDRLTEDVQIVLDYAIANPMAQYEIARGLFWDQPVGVPPGKWPLPADARGRARAPCLAAAEAARDFLTANGISLYMPEFGELPDFPELPVVSVAWNPLPDEKVLPPAPLVYYLADGRARRVMADLFAETYPTRLAKLWDRDRDALARLRRKLNAFARLEMNLWSFAADGGYDEPPPYAVRYDLARWLWHPSIAGSIFCLRCGDELRYVRSQRTAKDAGSVQHDSRTARCRACARGAEDDWPAHALEPYRRGTWLLRCQFSGCARAFVGRRNALYCPRHRASRMSPRLRTERRRRASGA